MVVAAGSLLVVLALVGPRLRQHAIEHAREGLGDQAELVSRLVRGALVEGAGIGELDAFVDEAAARGRARVTIIAPDGRVLADSEVSGEALTPPGYRSAGQRLHS